MGIKFGGEVKKRCNKCKAEKLPSEFNKCKSSNDGLQNKCKECQAAWYVANVELGEKFHLDHIVPLALGGANEDWNMQLLTAKCNLQKCAKHPIDFMQSRGFLL